MLGDERRKQITTHHMPMTCVDRLDIFRCHLHSLTVLITCVHWVSSVGVLVLHDRCLLVNRSCLFTGLMGWKLPIRWPDHRGPYCFINCLFNGINTLFLHLLLIFVTFVILLLLKPDLWMFLNWIRNFCIQDRINACNTAQFWETTTAPPDAAWEIFLR